MSTDDLVVHLEEKGNEIEEYLRNRKPEKKMWAWENDEFTEVEVWEIPRRYLTLNPFNGRFEADLDELRAKRELEQKDSELDPTNDEDILAIRKVLRGDFPENDQRAQEFRKLKDDILSKSQRGIKNGIENPGLIRWDGLYVNGNRRDTVLEQLSSDERKKKGEPLKFANVLVGRLSKNITPLDILQNEAKEQISQESREPYDYVNSALEIKKLFDMFIVRKFSPEKSKAEIVKVLTGRSKKDIDAYLDFLELADLILLEMGMEKKYRFIQEVGGGRGERGVVTILRYSVSLKKSREANANSETPDWSVGEISKWINQLAKYCVCSKFKVKDDNKKQLPFNQRDYRKFELGAMKSKETRKIVFDSGKNKKIDWENPENFASDFFDSIKKANNITQVEENIDKPAQLLDEVSDTLQSINKFLNSKERGKMVKRIKDSNGVQIISDIKRLASDIAKKIK